MVIATQQFANLRQTFGHQVIDGLVIPIGQGLFQPRQACVGAQPALARFGMLRSGDNLHQGSLACTIAPQQANALALVDLEVHAIQQNVGTEVEADIVEF